MFVCVRARMCVCVCVPACVCVCVCVCVRLNLKVVFTSGGLLLCEHGFFHVLLSVDSCFNKKSKGKI